MKRAVYIFMSSVLITAAVIAGWIGIERATERQIDIRQFDPDEVARLDTAMWRSYYSRERVRLYTELTELLQKQFQLPFWFRQRLAFRAAKAAFLFKDGKSRADYEQAYPDLEKFYSGLREISTREFDPKRVARLELEWWIIHRERERHSEGDLAISLALAASEFYKLPAPLFKEHAELRAEAMKVRDDKAAAGGVTEEDWHKIDDLLHRSWRSLHNAVNNN